MIRNVQLSIVVVRMLALVAILALASPRAEAQVVPFNVEGGGPAPEGLSIFGTASPHSATGTATHLGEYSGNGFANVVTFDPVMFNGTFKGTFVFVAANGDKLACTYGDTDNGAKLPGSFQIFDAGGGNVTVVFIAEFNPVPAKCTGRFENVVDGSFIMVAKTEPFPLVLSATGFTPPFNYTWKGAGWLEFDDED